MANVLEKFSKITNEKDLREFLNNLPINEYRSLAATAIEAAPEFAVPMNWYGAIRALMLSKQAKPEVKPKETESKHT